jgi:protein NrfD
MPQHFVAPPQWEWYIVWYFFFGGIAGGAYVIGTLLRLFGSARDEGAARIAFLISFPTMVICPILLTLDLGHPVRFWHMLINSRTFGLNFKYWSPMSASSPPCRSWRRPPCAGGCVIPPRSESEDS